MAYECSQSMRFQFNAQKCKVMRSSKERTTWKMGGEVIQEAQSFTYLGVEFGRREGNEKESVGEGHQTHV